MPLSYIEIFKNNLLHNIRAFQKYVGPKTKIASVIKANAYGHGQNEVAKILGPETDYFQVDDLQELSLLRQVTKKPALVLGYVAKNELADAVHLGAELLISDELRLRQLEDMALKLHQKIKIQIKIDALLGREGLLLHEVPQIIETLHTCPHVLVSGFYAHFANIEDTASFSHAQKQIDCFQDALRLFRRAGFDGVPTHISATSGTLVYDQNKNLNQIVRLGIGLYGLWPSRALQEKYQSRALTLKPVARWISHVAQIKTLPKGYSVGYGLTYATKQKTKIAVIPQGYSDGYDRRLSNKGQVLIGGRRCRVLGRISMNMMTVGVNHVPNAKQEDEVVLLGRQGQQEITAEEIAEQVGTINYEVVARISPLLPRRVV